MTHILSLLRRGDLDGARSRIESYVQKLSIAMSLPHPPQVSYCFISILFQILFLLQLLLFCCWFVAAVFDALMQASMYIISVSKNSLTGCIVATMSSM